MLLYLNTVLYYVISIACPILYVKECGGGIHPGSHYWYLGYSLINIIFEAAFVIHIQKTLQDEYLLDINSWHIIELIMG